MVIYRNTHLSFMSKNKKRIADQRGNESKPKTKKWLYYSRSIFKIKKPKLYKGFLMA